MTDVGDTVPLLRFLRSDALIPMIHPVPGLGGSNGAPMTFTLPPCSIVMHPYGAVWSSTNWHSREGLATNCYKSIPRNCSGVKGGTFFVTDTCFARTLAIRNVCRALASQYPRADSWLLGLCCLQQPKCCSTDSSDALPCPPLQGFQVSCLVMHMIAVVSAQSWSVDEVWPAMNSDPFGNRLAWHKPSATWRKRSIAMKPVNAVSHLWTKANDRCKTGAQAKATCIATCVELHQCAPSPVFTCETSGSAHLPHTHTYIYPHKSTYTCVIKYIHAIHVHMYITKYINIYCENIIIYVWIYIYIYICVYMNFYIYI